jgi:hypothetical protein
MAGIAVRETVTLAGRAERTRAARAFVSAILGPGHPCGDVAVLLVSEIFGNSQQRAPAESSMSWDTGDPAGECAPPADGSPRHPQPR